MTGTELSARDHGRLVVVELSGELDIGAAALLGAALTRVVARRPVIDVDLSPRHPLDSPALPYWVMRWTV